MKKLIATFLLIASLGTPVVSAPLYSADTKAKAIENSYLDTYWVEDDNEVSMVIEFEEGLLADNEYSHWKAGKTIGCEVSFTPAPDTAFQTKAGTITRIFLEVSLDTKSKPLKGTRTTRYETAKKSDGSVQSRIEEVDFTLGDQRIDPNGEPTFFELVDEDDVSTNQVVISFPKLKTPAKKK